MFEDAEIDHRVGGGELPPDEADPRDSTGDREKDHQPGVEPILALPVLEQVLQRPDTHGEQRDPDVVDGPGALLVFGIVDVGDDHHRGQNTDRKIHVEDPRPTVIVGEPATQRRTDRRPDHDTQTKECHRHARFTPRERFEEHGLRDGHQRAATHPLDDAPENQLRERGRCSAHEAGDGEDDDGSDEVAFAAEKIAEPTHERNDDDVGEDVPGGNPGDFVEAGAKVSHHVGQRDVDDRAVDDLHQRRQHDGEGDQVLVRRTLWRRRDWLC